MHRLIALLALAAMLAGCATAPPVARTWQQISAAPERPLMEAGRRCLYEVEPVPADYADTKQKMFGMCMAAQGWMYRTVAK